MSVQYKILDRIRRKGRGWVFTPSDFLDFGSRAAVDQGLSRLAKGGTVRRLRRGIYDYPRNHKRLGMLAPSTDAVAYALVRKDRKPLQVSGAQAANALGLTTHVPARAVYLGAGPPKSIRIDGRVIRFRKASPRNLCGMGSPAGDVFQAMRHLGKSGLDDAAVQRLRTILPDDVKKDLRRDLGLMPDWMRGPVNQITARI